MRCETKPSNSCISLDQKYNDKDELVNEPPACCNRGMGTFSPGVTELRNGIATQANSADDYA